MKSIILLPNKEKSLSRRHPWLFSGAIAKKDKNISEGEIIEVFSNQGKYLATGYFQNESIAVKILTFDRQQINQQFFDKTIQSAIEYRKIMGFFDDKDNTMFRIINAEGDFMPGFIADIYQNNVIVQFYSVGMYLVREMIIKALVANLPNIETIFSKSSSTMPNGKGIEVKDEFIWVRTTDRNLNLDKDIFLNTDEFWDAKENGWQFRIDFRGGQKTGFFIDQRSNRQLVSELSFGRTVLNCFCYTGGFSVAALKGGAKKVDSIDISKRALDICKLNVEINGFVDKEQIIKHSDKQIKDIVSQNTFVHETKCEDVIQYMEKIPDDMYDMIILDPPAFAKHQRDLNRALKGYRNINQKAIEKIKTGGLLFTFSCSQVVSRDDFATMLFSCSALAKRKVRIVRRLPHNFDHPQNIFHPEGEYLKGFLLYIE
ncbi:MAG: class I SAM-dependent rRNA methyltransferase [Bacteroidales bacterium]